MHRPHEVPVPRRLSERGANLGDHLFNRNAEERINWTSGSAFLRPLQVIPPRVARVAVKLTY